MTTYPDEDNPGTNDALFVKAHVSTEDGAEYVHKDLIRTVEPWAVEEHARLTTAERLGDVESWAAYIKAYSEVSNATTFLSWNAKGLRAVLDYPETKRWTADYPFELTPEFRRWSTLASGHAIELQKAVEFLEDNTPDIHEPDAASLLDLLRVLKANYTANTAVELRPDGTSKLAFSRDTRVSGPNEAELPNEITIAIPVLKGHVEQATDVDAGIVAGAPVRYKLVLKVRASADSNAKLSLRFNMPVMERVLEQVYAERVEVAAAALGDGFSLLRAAD